MGRGRFGDRSGAGEGVGFIGTFLRCGVELIVGRNGGGLCTIEYGVVGT